MLSTDLIMELISQLTALNGRPPLFDDIHRAAVAKLNISLADDDVMDMIEMLMAAGHVVKNDRGCFTVK